MKHDNDNKRVMIGPWLPTRVEAKNAGAIHFYTGIECKNGHTSPRVASTGQCTGCAEAWRVKNKQKIAEAYKEWAANNADHLKAYNDNWRLENKEMLNIGARRRAAKYRSEDREKFASRAREYYHRKMKDPVYREIFSTRSSAQRARRKLAEGYFNNNDVAEIIKRQRFKCAECGVSVRAKSNRHIDHITPLSRGGSNWPHNLQILCPPCNLSKGAKDPIDWAQSKGRLL